MKFFYLSSKPNGNGIFEIHERECPHIPDAIDRDYLGPFNNGHEALNRVKPTNPAASVCKHCCDAPSQPIFFSKRGQSEDKNS